MRFVPAVLVAVLLAGPLPAAAQALTAPADDSLALQIRTLTDALAAERQRLTALESTLADLSARLAGTAPLPSQPVSATRTVPAEISRFEFYGEVTARLDTLHQSYPDCPSCPSRTRGRVRLRFGAEGRLAPGFRGVLGLGAGELNDPNSTYQTLGAKFSRKVATWDRGYVNFRPIRAPWIDLTAGKFPYTWTRSSMTFDVDFYPEGASERFPVDLHRTGALKNVTVQGLQLIVSEQPLVADAMIIGGQVSGRLEMGRFNSLITFTGLDFTRPEYMLRAQLASADVGTRNTNAIIGEGGQAFYVSGFRYANLIAETNVRTPWESQPLTLAFEYQRNLRAVSARDSGVSFRLDAGRRQQRGDWGFAWHVFRVEQDAIAAALGESDWRAPTNVLQHRLFVNRVLHPNVQAVFTWYRGRTLDPRAPGAVILPNLSPDAREPWTNRLYFDVVYRY